MGHDPHLASRTHSRKDYRAAIKHKERTGFGWALGLASIKQQLKAVRAQILKGDKCLFFPLETWLKEIKASLKGN